MQLGFPVQGLIAGVLLGLNTTVFAYGATGSGKTYTMVGSPTDPGIMVLSMSDIFAFMVRSGPCTLHGVCTGPLRKMPAKLYICPSVWLNVC